MQSSHHARQLAVLNIAVASLAGRAASDSWVSEDAFQQAALEIWMKLESSPHHCCPKGSATPTVEAAAKLVWQRAIDRTKDQHRRRTTLSLDAPAEDGGTLGDVLPGARDDLEERLNALDGAAWRAEIERLLPARHAPGWQALRLKAQFGLEASEIADATGVSSGVVRQRMSRCAAWLRTHAMPLPLAA